MNLHKLLSFEQGRLVFFETLTKHPENWQQNPTPLSIVRKMLDKTSLDEKKILILFNIEFLQVLVEERKIDPKNIYYIADNELEYLGAIKIFKVQSYKLSDYSVPALKKLITGIDMKFDLVFSNPPYNRNTDIKIFNEVSDISGEMIVVHPSTWLLDLKNNTKLYIDFKKKISLHTKSLELFNGNSVFNIQLFLPCMITHIDKNYNGEISVNFFENKFISKSLDDVTIHSDKWESIVKSFYIQISEYCNINSNIWEHNVRNIDNTKFYCQLAAIRGTPNRSKNAVDMVLNDFYTMVMKNSNDNKGLRQPDLNKPGNPTPTFEFETENELDNFISYLKTDFARFCLSLLKNNGHLSSGEMNLIPWLDFTEEWDDEKLFKEFNVSQELQDYIREFLPDFHGIRK